MERMKWNEDYFRMEWSQEITNYDEKITVARIVASYARDNEVIGFGSGSTSFLAAQEIGRRIREEGLKITAIPTSNEIRMVCVSLGIPVATIDDVKPDWGFDGADEVTPEGWLIKGRGGAMFHEKLVMCNSPKTYILADRSKFVSRLCEKFPIPVECVPAACKSVTTRLYELGADDVHLRLSGKAKDGPVLTENGNYILDAHFQEVNDSLESSIKQIVGVLESGLFIGYPVEVLSC